MTATHGQKPAISVQRVRAGASLLAALPLFAGLASMAIAVSSCTNNLAQKIGASAGSILVGTSGVGADGGSAIAAIDSVLEDQDNPGGLLDIIGDGTGTLGTVCGASTSGSSSSSSSSTSICSCQYSYKSSNGTPISAQVSVSTAELNLVTCAYASNTLPTSATDIEVSVCLTSAPTDCTNAVPFSFTGSTSSNSPTDINSFAYVQRYQCKDVVTIPYVFGPSMSGTNAVYDPILSESAELSYPLDFYTSNIGGTYANYVNTWATLVSSTNPGYICPQNPVINPSAAAFNASTTNPYLFSVGADTDGSFMIYPPSASDFDRSTFYVAKTVSGVFSVPVDAYTAPGIIDDGSTGTPVGYAAAPISTGTGEETCPDTVAIPAGYQWAKLWLFRAALPTRNYLASNAFANAGSVACNPGTQSGKEGSGNPQVFSDCSEASSLGTEDGSLTGCAITGGTAYSSPCLADRLISGEGAAGGANPLCVGLSPTGAPGGGGVAFGPGWTTTGSCTAYNGPDFDSSGCTQGAGSFFTDYASGSDAWMPRHAVYAHTEFGPGSFVDPLDLSQGDNATLWSGSDSVVPYDRSPASVPLDASNRWDFLFVVSPETVMSGVMENSSNSANYPYIPTRFPNASDCLANSPNDCTGTPFPYQLVLQAVQNAANPSSTNVVFPMCVIQPVTN